MYERVHVLVETAERSFRGYVHKPVKDGNHRLSDYLNDLDGQFLCLTDVRINERGHQYRPGEKADFIAVSVGSITFVQPLAEEDAAALP